VRLSRWCALTRIRRASHSSGQEPALQHAAASPQLQLMGHAVRAVLDVAGREQRQNALFDLLDELAVPAAETASRSGVRSTAFQCAGTTAFPRCALIAGRLEHIHLILTRERIRSPK